MDITFWILVVVLAVIVYIKISDNKKMLRYSLLRQDMLIRILGSKDLFHSIDEVYFTNQLIEDMDVNEVQVLKKYSDKHWYKYKQRLYIHSFMDDDELTAKMKDIASTTLNKDYIKKWYPNLKFDN